MAKSESIHICLFGNERSIHVRRWVLSLREAGHRVDLITLKKDPDHDIGGISLQAGSKINYLVKINALRSLVKKIKPKIFHAHQASSYGFLASFVLHPRKILSVWGDDVIIFPKRNIVFGAITRRSLLGAHRITATSRYLKSTVLNLVTPKNDVTVIPFGIDLDFFRQVDRSPQLKIKIGIIKWLMPKYGIDILIKAFNQVIKNGHSAELIIAGSGPFESQYKQLVKDLGLNDNVKFLGLIEQKEVLSLLSSTEIFTMPSVTDGESFGVAALEASATGLPVIATKVGGVPEVIQDGVTGILVDRANVEQLAQAIIKLIKNPNLRATMGRAGRTFVEQNYCWHDNVRAMENLYREMLQ